jgi:hypothetical protein
VKTLGVTSKLYLLVCYLRYNRKPRRRVFVHSILELERPDFKFLEGIDWCVEVH